MLDSDHGLVGERVHQFYLLLGERPHLQTPKDDYADGSSFAHERDTEPRSKVNNPLALAEVEIWVGKAVGNMDRAALGHDAPREGPAAAQNRPRSNEVNERLRHAVMGGKFEIGASRAKDARDVGFAQPRRRFDQRIEHGLQVKSRSADNLEHVGRGGLLLSRLSKFAGKSADLLLQIGKG